MEPLTDAMIAVLDAAFAEEWLEELGFEDDQSLMERYRAHLRAKTAQHPAGE